MKWTVRRSQQYCAKAGDSDLIVQEYPDLFVECKWVQALNITKVMKIAVEQAGSKLPAVFHRRNKTEWLMTIRLTDLPRLVQMLTPTTSGKPSLPSISPGASSLPPLESRPTPVAASDPESPSDST
jgi:hypothetical protein